MPPDDVPPEDAPLGDDPDEPEPTRGPLPPEDRIWRHPSELAGAARSARPATVDARRPRSRGWLLAIASMAIGSLATVSVLALAGAFDDPSMPTAVEQVQIAVSPDPNTTELALGLAVLPTVARVESLRGGSSSFATAVIVRSDGHLLTTADAVEGSEAVTVTFYDGSQATAVVLGSDEDHDVAVLHVERLDLPIATLMVEGEPDLAERVIALTATERWPDEHPIGAGVVSALGQRLEDEEGALHGMVQTHVSLPGRTSGSVLVSADGAVIGIVTSRGMDGGGGEADDLTLQRHYASPIGWLKKLADQIVATGTTSLPWLGIEGIDAEEEELDGRQGAAKVKRVVEGSPAEGVELRPEDLVTALAGKPVESMSELVVVLRNLTPGERVPISWQRDGRGHIALVELTERGGDP